MILKRTGENDQVALDWADKLELFEGDEIYGENLSEKDIR